FSQPEGSNELFQKLFEDSKELAEYDNSPKVSEEQKQSMGDTMLELVKICQEKEFLCMHDNVDDLIESALNTKLLSINSQHLEKEQQEVKNVVEQPAERGNRKPEHPLSMGYEHLSITPETESDEVTYSNAKNLLPILSECEVTSEEKRDCDVPVSTIDVCDNHSDIFSDSKDDDDISVYDDDFEDIDDNTTHANDSLPEYDSFCFENEPDQERLINLVKNDISDDSNDPLLEEADLFIVFDNSIPPGIENVADDSEGDIRFLEELLIDDFILSHESSDSYFEDNPSVPQPPPKPPDAETDAEEITVVINNKDKFDEDYHFFMLIRCFLYSPLRVRILSLTMYPDVHPPSQEMNEEVFQAEGELMKSIQTVLEKFNCIPFEEKPQILFQAWEKKFAIQFSQPEGSNELFQKVFKDSKELAEYDNSPSKDRPIFLNDDSDQNKECFENSSDEIAASNPNQEKEGPPQDSDIRKQIREECSVEVSEEKKQSMGDTMLELVKICQEKEFLCMHDNVDDLIESALNTKLLSINSQHLEKEQQEVKNAVEQPAERGNRSIQFVPILSTKEPKHPLSMGYEHLSITPETESDEVTESNAENLLPIPSECEVTSEEKRDCDVPVSTIDVCDNHSDIFSDSKDDDDISVYDDDFEDIEYVEASLSNPEIVNQAEENDVEEEEVDLEDISQIQDVVLCEILLSITRLISNIESLNENSTPDCVLNSFASDNSLSDNFSPEFKTFCDHTKETRSDNTTHANDSLPEYDSFCFEIEPDQERLINLVKNDISDDSNDPLLEEADLFIVSDNSIPPGIENVTDDSEGDIRFLEELLIDDSILSRESSDSYFEDNPSVPRPPPELPDAETDAEEIPVVIYNKDKFDEDYHFFMFDKVFSLLSTESEDAIFDPGFFPPVIEVFLCWIFVPVSKIFISFDLNVWRSPYPLIYIA
nr:hypothetical protein [Tanacetum cinerariifolium]